MKPPKVYQPTGLLSSRTTLQGRIGHGVRLAAPPVFRPQMALPVQRVAATSVVRGVSPVRWPPVPGVRSAAPPVYRPFNGTVARGPVQMQSLIQRPATVASASGSDRPVILSGPPKPPAGIRHPVSFQKQGGMTQGIGASGKPASVQCLLVNSAGQMLTDHEVNVLLKDYPNQKDDIEKSHGSPSSFTVRITKSGLKINPQALPKKSYHYSVPQNHTVTYGLPTATEAAKNIGFMPTLKRVSFKSDFTDEMMDSELGPSYVGAEQIENGRGLKESGLDRTHHLSDSSIRVILQYLHENRGWQHTHHSMRVLDWMKALNSSDSAKIYAEFTSGPLTQLNLEGLVDRLSNNVHQVGFGNAHINERVVGPYFDASRTMGGFETPQSAMIAMYTRYLETFGLVPKNIIDSALAQLVDPSGKLVTSMQYNLY
jgi:hypothetical protein